MRQYAMTFITIALLTAAAGAVTADDAPARKTIAETIAPVIDAQTLAVVRIDVAKIHFAEIADWFRSLIRLEDPTNIFSTTREGQFDAWKDGLLASGAREVYLLVSPGSSPAFLPTLVVPVPDGADAGAILKAIRTRVDGKPGVEHGPYAHGVSGVEGRFVIAAVSEQHYQRVAAAQTAARPEMAAALGSVADSAVQLILIPSDDIRRVVAETLPQAPPPLTPTAAPVLVQGIRWASLGINPPPAMSATLTIQSADGDAAQALSNLMAPVIAMVAYNAQAIAGLDPAQLTADLTPTVRGDQLTLELKRETVNRILIKVITPIIGQARQRAKQESFRLAL